MLTIEQARSVLASAANRLTAAHADPHLSRDSFDEVLETYLLATKAYHQSIRQTNERLLEWRTQH